MKKIKIKIIDDVLFFERGEYVYKIQNIMDELYIGEKESYGPVVRIRMRNNDVNMNWTLNTNGRFKDNEIYNDFKVYVDHNS